MSLIPGPEYVTCLDDHFLNGCFLLREAIDRLRESADEVLIHAAIDRLEVAFFREWTVPVTGESWQQSAIGTPCAVNDFFNIEVQDCGNRSAVGIHLHSMPCATWTR